MNHFLTISGICGFLGVAIGAFGAHGLKIRLSTLGTLASFETGVQYHFIHTLSLLAVAILLRSNPDSALLKSSGYLFLAGIIVFSGSLYILSITGQKWWGAITPIGGVCFLAGWITLTVAAIKNPGLN